MPFDFFQDSTIALKIFELAFKKFGHQVEFQREYLSFISHLNGKQKLDLI